MGKNVQIGDNVMLGSPDGVAKRYHNRMGRVVGRTGKTGNGRFVVSMGARRAEPLTLPRKAFTAFA